MIKTLFLMPVVDNDGRSYSRADWRELEDRLLAFGGFSMVREVNGAWAAGGRVYRDTSRQYGVSLDSWSQFATWLDVIRWARGHFRQLAIYIEVAGLPEIIEG